MDWLLEQYHRITETLILERPTLIDTGPIYATNELKHLWETGVSPNVHQTGCAPNIPGENIFSVLMIRDTLRQLVTHISQSHTEDLYWELILRINISRALTLQEQIQPLRERESLVFSWGAGLFQYYMVSQDYTAWTDHEPLNNL